MNEFLDITWFDHRLTFSTAVNPIEVLTWRNIVVEMPYPTAFTDGWRDTINGRISTELHNLLCPDDGIVED